MRELLNGAGWKDVTFTPFTDAMTLGTSLEEALEYASRMGPAARLLRTADDAMRDHAVASLRATIAGLAPGFSLPSAVWIVTAKG